MKVTEVMVTTFNNVGKFLSKNQPAILTGMGVAGVASTAYLASKATLKTSRELEDRDLEKKEVAKIVVKNYIPTVVSGVTAAACIIGANKISTKRVTTLATAYSVSERALRELETKVKEEVGDKKFKKIKDDINRDRVINNPINSNEVISTGGGNITCFDAFSGRYFASTPEKIHKAVNDINYMLMNEMYVSLNEFYYQLGIPSITQGNEFGWNINVDGQIDIQLTSTLDESDRPILVMDYRVQPRMDVSRLL